MVCVCCRWGTEGVNAAVVVGCEVEGNWPAEAEISLGNKGLILPILLVFLAISYHMTQFCHLANVQFFAVLIFFPTLSNIL